MQASPRFASIPGGESPTSSASIEPLSDEDETKRLTSADGGIEET